MGLVGAGKDTEDGDEVVHVYCSICLNAVKCGGDRSTAKLQCGHEFHLDCIGSAFNAKGVMQCPNCRKVEEGNWFYANGYHSTPELTMDEWIQDEDLYNLNYAESGSHGIVSRAGATGSSAPSLVPPYLRTHGNGHEHYQLQHSQIMHGTGMPLSGSLWSFNPAEQCGPFLVSPAVQTNVDAENITSTRLYAWERQCFAPHPFFPIDREPSCWGPFLQANGSGVSDSSPPQMVYFPLNSSERLPAQAGHNRPMPPPPPRMLPLL